MKYIEDTVLHKKFVMDACYKMANWLFSIDRDKEAFSLLQRASLHDNQKFKSEEISCMSQIIGTNNGMINPNYTMQDSDKMLIETHWKNNRHHPEYFKDISNMEELDIIEMVCDWYARQMQYKTDFMEFVITRQGNRFHFPDTMFKKILSYCKILDNSKDTI